MKMGFISAIRYFLCLGILTAALPASVGAQAAWQQEWEQVLKAAKKEGKVAVLGPTGNHRRDALVIPFQKQYGITVEYKGDRGSGVPPLIGAQQRAGHYLWDVFVGGTTTGLTSLIPIKALQPMDPFLIFPDVKDPKTWRSGAMEFVDPGRQTLVMSPSQRATVFVHKDMKPGTLKSYKDL
ncbi:MAG TPA: hypothetical protein VGB25_06720, partial [Candidatus Binatia bacterium]